MKKFSLSTPVALFIFNRPDCLKRVLERIESIKPSVLLVVCDGPREDIAGETEIVAQCRALIDKVSWGCKVLRNFSDKNLGCRGRVSSGLDWVFEQVNEAIILEDDCLPDPSFFRFCQELLGRYRKDQRVGMISGTNFQFGHKVNDDSYYFSNLNHIWGWATWRDRWQADYDVDLNYWPKVREENRVDDWFGTTPERKSFIFNLERTYRSEIDTWDYQWWFASRLNGRVSIIPNKNLVSNIGYGPQATHTKGHNVLSELPTSSMPFPLKHPKTIFASQSLDTRFFLLTNRLTLSKRLKIWLIGLLSARL